MPPRARAVARRAEEVGGGWGQRPEKRADPSRQALISGLTAASTASMSSVPSNDRGDGDSPRWIHWRTTARVGAPMVRELDRTAGTGLVVVADLANSTPGHAEATLSFLATLVMTWAQHQDGRLTIAFTVEGDWRRLNIQHRRGAETALRALAEWPTIMSGTQAWPTHDARLNWARVLIVAVAPTRALPPGLVGTIINIDPALPSPYYQPPEKLNV